jgi:hypothetical protein
MGMVQRTKPAIVVAIAARLELCLIDTPAASGCAFMNFCSFVTFRLMVGRIRRPLAQVGGRLLERDCCGPLYDE